MRANENAGGQALVVQTREHTFPVIEAYVEKHAKLTQVVPQKAKQKRKTKHEDCCKYCEIYCEDKITDSRHKEIVLWTQDVNRNMEVQEKLLHKRVKSPVKQLKFLKYDPLGYPDVDEGFRVVSAKSEYRNGLKSRESNHVNVVRSDLRELSLRFDKENPRSRSRNSGLYETDRPLSHGRSDKLVPIDTRVQSERGLSGYSSAMDGTLNESIECDGSDRSDNNSTQMSSRSCSNELLNCITIDDAFRKHRQKMMSKNPWSESANGGRNSQLTKTPESNVKAIESAAQNIDYLSPYMSSPRHSQMSSPRFGNSNSVNPDSASDFDYNEMPNEAMMNTIDEVIKKRDIVHNDACRGLFKYDKHYQQNESPRPESKRFKKLNRNLHKVIESDYMPLTKLQRKVKERVSKINNDGNQSTEEPETEPKALPPPKPSLTPQKLFPNTGKVYFKGVDARLIDSVEGDFEDEEDREHFLEMLMGMDEIKEEQVDTTVLNKS